MTVTMRRQLSEECTRANNQVDHASHPIVNNQGYSALKAFGQRFGLGNPVGSDIVGVDFCKIAEGQGLEARRVADPAELDAALRWSFDAKGPTLVEVLTVPDPDARPWWAES
jgi:thiamine pyrophosphate-dependent acetolactate synthase large subunit-like protein